MKIGFEVFLVVAREMSITKAANELHITQQCASDHIKRLEKEYNVVLFERRPKFRLTQAGEIMLHNLLNIQIMETSMSRSLAGIAEGTVGGFTLGISTSRAPIILPRVLPRYYQCYPKVNISFTEEDTQILEERLLNGQVDLFIGVNTSPHPDYKIQTLTTDEIILVISAKLLRREFSKQEIRQMEDGIDLKRFSNIPFTRLQEVMVLIEELIRKIPMAEKLLEIKGVGIRTVSGFLAEVGDISRFNNPKELQKLAGFPLIFFLAASLYILPEALNQYQPSSSQMSFSLQPGTVFCTSSSVSNIPDFSSHSHLFSVLAPSISSPK